MCGNSKAPKAPNYAPIAQAQMDQSKVYAKIAQDQLDWSKQMDAQNQKLLDQVLSVQLPAMRLQYQNAVKDRSRYDTEFVPFEKSLEQEAQNYASPDYQEQQAGRAVADVNTQFDLQREAATRSLESYGVDPTQTRAAALDVGMRSQQAATQAQAANTAREATKQKGIALTADVANMGRGLPAQSAQGFGAATGGGSQALQGGLSTTQTGASTMGTGSQWAGTGMQSAGQGFDILNAGYQNQLNRWQANQGASNAMWSGLGGLTGQLGAAYLMGPGAKAKGGLIDDGDGVIDPRRGTADDVPINASEGEFVIPEHTVRHFGTKKFYDMIAQSKKAHGDGVIPQRRAA